MKTKEEFLAQVNLVRGRRMRSALEALAVVYLVIGVTAGGGIFVLRYLGILKNSPLFIVPIIVMLVGIIASGWVMKRRELAVLRKIGLFCPSCGETLTEHDAKIAVATYNCPYCGLPIFQE